MTGMKVYVVPDHLFPQEHYATEIVISRWPWHWRLWHWLMGRDMAKCYTVIGLTDLYRPVEQAYTIGGNLFCTARFKQELEKST